MKKQIVNDLVCFKQHQKANKINTYLKSLFMNIYQMHSKKETKSRQNQFNKPSSEYKLTSLVAIY